MKRGISHNTHPGEFLRTEIIEPNNLTIKAAAVMLGVTRPTLSNIVNEKVAISPMMAIRLAKVFGGSAELWVRMQASHDLREAETKTNQLQLQPYHYNLNPK